MKMKYNKNHTEIQLEEYLNEIYSINKPQLLSS